MRKLDLSDATTRTLLLLVALGLCALVYWPGLYGGYIFDDFPFLVNNDGVHVTSLDLGDWVRAITSFPAAHQGRWLTMFTLAANYWATGLDPFWIKLTNLAIHLLNACLIYGVLRALLRLRGGAASQRDEWTALAITACWLVVPINLTAVLYAVQRLESLSNTFVFLGLLWYLRARVRYAASGSGLGSMAAALVVCTGIGLLAKESAILLPLYAACTEIFVAGLRDAQGRWRRPVIGLYAALLVVPLLAGLVWLASWISTPTAYVRAFSTTERLLTEARVLVDYMHWTVLPTPKVASLYHDDVAISTGLLSPPSTLLSLVFLVGLAGSTFWIARRRPLLALGIAWFFAAHMLTATIIPLELVFEHRNYFASLGLLLALASALALEPLRTFNPRLLGLLAGALLAFYTLQTTLRAREWAHPLKLALTEMSNNPRSPRANYEFARTLLFSPQIDSNPELVRRAFAGLATCSALPRSGILCEQGSIILSARLGQPIDPALWRSVLDKLALAPPSESDIGALTELVNCQINQVCPPDDMLIKAMTAAKKIAPRQPRIAIVHGAYLWRMHREYGAAEQMIRTAVAEAPEEPAYRAYLIELLLETGQTAQAQVELDALRRLDNMGSLAYMLDPLQHALDSGAQATPQPTRPDTP